MTPAVVHRLRLTKAGWYWLAVTGGLVAIALLKNINLLLVVGCFALVLLVANWLQVRRGLRRVQASVEMPEGVNCGSVVRASIQLSNSSLFGLPKLDCQVHWAKASSHRQSVAIPSRMTVDLTCAVIPTRRGTFASATLELRNSFPFGLVEAVRRELFSCRSWVYPSIGEVESRRIVRGLNSQAAIRGQRRMTVRHLSDGTDIHGLRPFRDGDSPRWIHWRTTARVGAPMVRELDRTAGTGLVVVADLANSTPGHAEATLSFLATLVMTWAQHQDGRLTIAFTVEGDWRRLNIQHRRGAQTALRALAEWPTIMSGTQAWPTHDARLNWARVLIVAVAPTRALPPGLVGTIINIDPALPSPYYQPPEKLNV